MRSAASRTSPGAGRQAEAALRGEAANRAAFAKAADILLRDAKGFAHNAFKVGLARRAVERALDAGGERHAAVAIQQEDTVSAMAPYVGTATSRVDGRAKVTGAAKYAAEFNVPGLAHGSVVTSTMAKGRIARLDTSQALLVAGVIDVLTHENRPRMAGANDAYKDDVAPKGRLTGRSTMIGSCSTASRSRWWSPRNWR